MMIHHDMMIAMMIADMNSGMMTGFMCYERLQAEAYVNVCFITAGPITKLCAWGEEESGGHVL